MDPPKLGQWQKKTLNCDDSATDQQTRDAHERGRRIYNARCYFCHGYSGDARTAAAQYLSPRPRDFTAAAGLTAQAIAAVLRVGKPGTAMKRFSDVLVEDEIRTVARFVEAEFVRCGAANTRYHTAANGWPDHEIRNAPAIPFVSGNLAADLADGEMTDSQRRGLEIFRHSCIVCHEGRMAAAAPGVSLSRFDPSAGIADKGREAGHDEDHHDIDEYADKTVSPPIDNLTPRQRLGEELYRRACAQCHARDGTGRHWVGRFLKPAPTDFNDPAILGRYDDATLDRLILQGRPETSMPAFRGLLSAGQSAAIIAYMRRAFAGMEQ